MGFFLVEGYNHPYQTPCLARGPMRPQFNRLDPQVNNKSFHKIKIKRTRTRKKSAYLRGELIRLCFRFVCELHLWNRKYSTYEDRELHPSLPQMALMDRSDPCFWLKL